eukprot:9468912-Alexandrium_andersonii.AAC.1
MPTAMKKALGLHWKPDRLPKMYVTMKGKCFASDGNGKHCEKAGHSCCRKVVSFSSLKAKREWGLACRSIETS